MTKATDKALQLALAHCKQLKTALQEIDDEIPAKPKLPLVVRIREIARAALRDGHIDIWYDRQTRSWIRQVKDVAGNQIGVAEYSHRKPKS